jgi:hypothetical protein
MGSGTVISIGVIVVGFVLVVIAVVMRRRRSRHLKQWFGPEYNRAVLEQQGDSRAAEAVLANREKRVHAFPLRALSAVDREDYAAEWMAVQLHFVENPSAAAGVAERLISRAMTDRGYPESDFEQKAADISVSYPTLVQNYRAAYEIVARHGDSHATIEKLSQAMVYYRSLFDKLLEPAKDEFPEPAWDELYAPSGDELLEPAKDELLEPAKDELLEPAKIEVINRRGRRVTRERAS